MHKFFLKVYHFFEQNPAVMCGLMLVTIGLCVISALRLDFVEDISSFLPSNGQNERINYAYEHLGGDNRIVVNIAMADTKQDPDVDLLSEAADLFAETLGELDTAHHAKQVLASVDVAQISEVTEFVLQNLPYFLTDEDYVRLDSMLSPEYINRQIANDKQLLASPIPMMRTMIQHDPLFISSNVLQSLNAFKMDDSYHSESDHIFNQKGNEALVVVSSNYPISETKNNAVLIQNIDKAAEQVMKALDGKVKVHSFGASQVSLTNSRQIKKDSFTAIGLALIFILALLIYYYRNARSIILIFLSTLFGGLFENMVIADMLKNRLNRGLQPDLYFMRTSKGVEIDLVMENARRLDLYEIKSSASFSADFAKNISLLADIIPEVGRKTVVYSGKGATVNGVEFVNFTAVK